MTNQPPISGLKDNYRRGKGGEFLDAKIDPGAQLSFVSAYFTLHAYHALHDALESKDYAIFPNHGYVGLYGGLGAQDIHARKGLKKTNRACREVGAKVRQTIKELGGMMPENLPATGSIKKLETKATKALKGKKP